MLSATPIKASGTKRSQPHEHLVEHATHTDRTEGGHHDAVGLAPVGLLAIGGEQPILGDGA